LTRFAGIFEAAESPAVVSRAAPENSLALNKVKNLRQDIDFMKTPCIIVYMKSRIKECFQDAECGLCTISLILFVVFVGVAHVA
tara:strand:+ start:135 stop:386 length:252 start_codon:yes stop_codon:yes gene_type:complete